MSEHIIPYISCPQSAKHTECKHPLLRSLSEYLTPQKETGSGEKLFVQHCISSPPHFQSITHQTGGTDPLQRAQMSAKQLACGCL